MVTHQTLIYSLKNTPWYRNGLAFNCLQCGNCCAGPQEGYVWISRPEIKALADFLKMSPNEIKQKYLRRIGLCYSFIEKPPTKDCIFLNRDPDHPGLCKIYPVRPLQCRTWPFWKENLRSAAAWRAAAAGCPGIGRGLWYDYRQIEALRSGDLTRPLPNLSIEDKALNWIKNNLQNHAGTQALQKIYRQIDLRLEAGGAACENCGQCCDFARFGHRLYATTLEILYFLQGITSLPNTADRLKLMPMAHDRCPYQHPQGCRIRPYRFASCRIFYCKNLDPAFQNEISEHALGLIRRLHDEFHAVYLYADLALWLSKFTLKNDTLIIDRIE